VLVPMPIVIGMAVPVVHIVNVITMGHSHMSATKLMLVGVTFMSNVIGLFTLIDMVTMNTMQTPVVDIVDVITVRHGDMPATGAMDMVMISVLTMLGRYGHELPRTRTHSMRNPSLANEGLMVRESHRGTKWSS
jgi:hypothetical protein